MTKKARNGEGSIFEIKDKSGAVTGYAVEVSLGRDSKGRRVRTRRKVKTRREAQELRSRLTVQHLDGRLTIIHAQTVRTYGLEWVRDVKSQQVRASTAYDYEARLRREVFPGLGSVRMIDLGPRHIDAWMASLRRMGKSASTINGARQVLNAMCKHAYRTGILASNPVTATDPVKRQFGDPTQVRPPWSPQEVRALLEAVRDDELDGFLHLMLHTGLRPGEAVGLRWQDVDLFDKRLVVSGTLKEVRAILPSGHGVVRQVRNEPKTSASRRTLTISNALMAAFDRQQMRQSVQRMSAGDDWVESGYVFTTSHGTPYSLSNLRRRYKRFLAAAGLRYIRLHDIRHTVAVMALDGGRVPIEQASQAFGHTRIDTTKQIYAGVVPRYNDEFIEGLSAVLPPAPTPNPPEPGDAHVLDVRA
ncbi:MAG: tyrosine-type recombinase/integrase [Actinomycetota bacterium]|nr:tyrosine-type recombinase/integrase [Actinomycetota bacterium]